MADVTSISAPPEGYQQVYEWRLSQHTRTLWLVNILSIPTWLVSVIVLTWIALECHPFSLAQLTQFSSFQTWLLVLSWIPLVIVHEGIHGLSMSALGAQPRYGFLPSAGAFYATAPGHLFARSRYLLVALSPLVIISLLALAIILFIPDVALLQFVIFFASLNAAGACGDLWISCLVLKYPTDCLVMDEKDGMRIFRLSRQAQPRSG
jgi:hypothetical protein